MVNRQPNPKTQRTTKTIATPARSGPIDRDCEELLGASSFQTLHRFFEFWDGRHDRAIEYLGAW